MQRICNHNYFVKIASPKPPLKGNAAAFCMRRGVGVLASPPDNTKGGICSGVLRRLARCCRARRPTSYAYP